MLADRVLAIVDTLTDEAVAFTSELIRIPTVNPPGELYEECARLIGDTLAKCRVRGRVLTPPRARPNTPNRIRASTSSAPGAAARCGRSST